MVKHNVVRETVRYITLW